MHKLIKNYNWILCGKEGVYPRIYLATHRWLLGEWPIWSRKALEIISIYVLASTVGCNHGARLSFVPEISKQLVSCHAWSMLRLLCAVRTADPQAKDLVCVAQRVNYVYMYSARQHELISIVPWLPQAKWTCHRSTSTSQCRSYLLVGVTGSSTRSSHSMAYGVTISASQISGIWSEERQSYDHKPDFV
jgi:hypothetical protein